ncbi:MAG: hypothetical protein KDD36_01080 [Flavobacteriales bacterium]|nr:hypothetical protein [Flavobacteriales bacterium]
MKRNLLIAFVAVACVLTACKKYEEGPAFSLRSAKARLSGDWKVASFSIDGVDQTASYLATIGNNFVIDIEKDGKYRVEGSFTDEGSWELGEDGDDVRFKSDAAGSTEDSYRILKLKNKELWLKQTQTNGEVHETHFEPAD